MNWSLDFIQTTAVGAIALFLGVAVLRRMPVLRRYNIPAAVVGGLVIAILVTMSREFNVATVQFDTTLPRFDLMAQLERNPDGLKMNDLSRRMMVSGGNVTGITDQLVTEGLVERVVVDGDRRSFRVKLTDKGHASFADMAAQHENWIVDAFASLKDTEIATLYKLLGNVKKHSLKTNLKDNP